MMRKLKISSFAANFGTDEYLGTRIMIRKPGSRPVSLNQAHTLMKHRCPDTCIIFNLMRQSECGIGMGSNYQHLIFLVALQECAKPVDPRIAIVDGQLWCQKRFRTNTLVSFNLLLWRSLIQCRKWVNMEFTLWKTLDDMASITKQHAPGTMSVKQMFDQRLLCRRSQLRIFTI